MSDGPDVPTPEGGRPDAPRPRRPVFFDDAELEAHGGVVDPVRQIEAAHASAATLVNAGRSTSDPAVTARLVALVEDLGLSTLAELWSERPTRSLPGALWRLYVLREWVRRDPEEASREYAAGIRHTGVDHAVAGAAEPPGPRNCAPWSTRSSPASSTGISGLHSSARRPSASRRPWAGGGLRR